MPEYVYCGDVVRTQVTLPELVPISCSANHQAWVCAPVDDNAAAAAPIAAAPTIHTWHDEDEREWLRICGAPGAFGLHFAVGARFQLAGRTITWCADGLPAATVRHLLLDQVLPLAMSEQGDRLLHAAAVAIDGAAVLIAGRSGAGKSTLAAACVRHGHALLADDCVRLTCVDSRWSAYPSYPGLRLWPDAAASLDAAPIGDATVAHYSR